MFFTSGNRDATVRARLSWSLYRVDAGLDLHDVDLSAGWHDTAVFRLFFVFVSRIRNTEYDTEYGIRKSMN
jgi:hypothetical protein